MSEKEEISEIKKRIVIERLRQAPPTVNISFGMPEGKFMNRDELIKNVETNTEIGEKIVNIQLAYLKEFKKGFLMNN
jgi:hypothetical protein